MLSRLITHIDKGHVHNHLIFCSVDFAEHKKYISNRKRIWKRYLHTFSVRYSRRWTGLSMIYLAISTCSDMIFVCLSPFSRWILWPFSSNPLNGRRDYRRQLLRGICHGEKHGWSKTDPTGRAAGRRVQEHQTGCHRSIRKQHAAKKCCMLFYLYTSMSNMARRRLNVSWPSRQVSIR